MCEIHCQVDELKTHEGLVRGISSRANLIFLTCFQIGRGQETDGELWGRRGRIHFLQSLICFLTKAGFQNKLRFLHQRNDFDPVAAIYHQKDEERWTKYWLGHAIAMRRQLYKFDEIICGCLASKAYLLTVDHLPADKDGKQALAAFSNQLPQKKRSCATSHEINRSTASRERSTNSHKRSAASPPAPCSFRLPWSIHWGCVHVCLWIVQWWSWCSIHLTTWWAPWYVDNLVDRLVDHMAGQMVNHPVDHLVNHLADQMAGHLADHLDAYSLDDSLSYVDTTLNFTNIPLLLFLSLHLQILC